MTLDRKGTDPLARVWEAIPAKYPFSSRGKAAVMGLYDRVIEERDFERRFYASQRDYKSSERAKRARRAALYKAARALQGALNGLPAAEARILSSRLDWRFRESPGIRLELLRPTLTALISIANPLRHRRRKYDARLVVAELDDIWNQETALESPEGSWAQRSCLPAFVRAFVDCLPSDLKFSAAEVETALRIG